jgi:lipid A 3-O-deacylase
MTSYKFFSAVVLGFIAGAPLSYSGQEQLGAKTLVPSFSAFEQGTREFQVGVGAFFALNSHGEQRPQINDVDGSLRLGWMLNSPSGSGFFRGNFEFLAELAGAVVVEGPGTGLGGGNLLLRYNFVQPDARLVPYFQIGAGGLFNDIYKSHPQRLVGQCFEFELQGAFGARYFLNPRCALSVEAGYRHISNADMANRNLGLNSLGGLVGVSWFF